jgi:hypothetical protein
LEDYLHYKIVLKLICYGGSDTGLPMAKKRERVVQDEPELLLSWVPGALTPNEEIEEFRRK